MSSLTWGTTRTIPEPGEQSRPEIVARVRHTSTTATQVHISAAGLGSSQEVKSVGQDQDQRGKWPSTGSKAQASNSQTKLRQATAKQNQGGLRHGFPVLFSQQPDPRLHSCTTSKLALSTGSQSLRTGEGVALRD